MKLIVGLGNPGSRYSQTRHNIGLELLNFMAATYQCPPARRQFSGLLTEATFAGEKLLLLAPQTYMNASGQSVRQCFDFYKLEVSNVLVLLDDMNLDLAKLRMRGAGSSGGQKGLQDIIHHLGTEEIPRLRIGIGRPPSGVDPANYVLQAFSSQERLMLKETLQTALCGIEHWVSRGIEQAMNWLNQPSQSR